jgi:hypothetical protein
MPSLGCVLSVLETERPTHATEATNSEAGSHPIRGAGRFIFRLLNGAAPDAARLAAAV